jgi:hypothetical protein
VTESKISVYMRNDNPYAALWTLIGAKLFSRPDGTSPLIGFNWSNSVNNATMEITAQIRRDLGFEDPVRFEHHITETYKSIVRQPYDRDKSEIEEAGETGYMLRNYGTCVATAAVATQPLGQARLGQPHGASTDGERAHVHRGAESAPSIVEKPVR